MMWLRVEDGDIHEAEQLRVTVSAVENGRGKKKRKRCQCKVIFHGSSKEEPVAGFKRFAAALKADPRLCGDAQRDLKQNCLVKKIVGAVTQVECKRVRGTAAVTTQTQALADFSLQVRKGSTWPLRVEEDQEGEEGRFWLAKIKDEPERLEGTMTFAGQAFKRAGSWRRRSTTRCSASAARRQPGSGSTSCCRPTLPSP